MKILETMIRFTDYDAINNKNDHAYVTNIGKVVTNNSKELLVASSDDLADIEMFISRSPADRLAYFNSNESDFSDDDKELFSKVKRTFREPAGMRPVYDENGNLRLFYDQKEGKPYDIFYVKDTFEELPQGAFSMKQRVITLLGPVNATKTTIAELWNLMLCDTLLENSCISAELANRPGSPVFRKYCDISERFSRGCIPERSHRGEEIQETSYTITYTNPVTDAKVHSLFQIKDIAGEDWQELEFGSYVLNKNRIPVIVIPMNDLIARHQSNNYVSSLDKYLLNYAIKAKDMRLLKEYEPIKPIFIISNFDVAAGEIQDQRIEEIWNQGSSLVRKDKIRLERHKDGIDLGYVKHVSHDLLIPFLREYARSILNKMEDICGGEEPMVFACAAVGEEPRQDADKGFIYPEGFVPFNLDEPLLYLLNREGMYPAKDIAEEEQENGNPFFKNILQVIWNMEYGDEM